VPGSLHLGTSGFAYPEWKGVFYPEGLKSREMLPYFASRFGSVEINYTFRRHPSERTLETWRSATPDGFSFALKAHHFITHRHRLAAAEEPVRTFIEQARRLGDRLGVVLFQCPPTLRFDRDLLDEFLKCLPEGGRYAMEFRHPSWHEARGFLAERGVAWCTAETEQQPADRPSWEPFGYLRLRKERYTDAELAAWAERIRWALGTGHEVYCFFKHEEKGLGPVYAERLKGMLTQPGGR
jgi:uncharacterized protein YecE (DUF72 family)